MFGDGKTAVRGGFGTSYNRLGDGQYGGFTGVISRTVNLQWTTIDDRFNAPSLENPLNGTMVQDETRPITVHSWSVGVQRELPWRLLADVAYVGNTVRNAFAVNAGQSYTNQLNDPDPRLVANPTPDMIDRTTGNVLPTNFIRPNYPGRGGDHPARLPGRDAPQLQRHPVRGPPPPRERLRLGGNYTGSVTKQYTAYDWFRTPRTTSPEHPQERQPAAQREDHLQLDDAGGEPVPGQQRHCQGVLDGWQLSGSRPLLGGPGRTFRRNGLCFTGSPSANTDGGLGGMRPIIVCDPNLPRSERTFERQHSTECAAAGPADRSGRHALSGHRRWRRAGRCRMGLGYINHDLTLMKNFSLGNGRNIQVRAEFYNASTPRSIRA